MLCDPNVLSWWKYRQDLIWTLEVDDLLKVNAENTRKLFTFMVPKGKKLLHIEDAIRAVSNCSGLAMTDKGVTLAFAYSKYPVIDEMKDIKDLSNLNIGEF